MKRIVRLTERDLTRIVKRVIREQEVGTALQPDEPQPDPSELSDVKITRYKILLKNPDEDGFTYYVYNPGTGEILGDGKRDAVVLNYQENKTKDEVLRFLNKNGIKTK